MAKKVRLYSVKVGSGSESRHDETMLSKCLMGMAFAALDSRTRNCPNGTVANLSFGTWHSHAINDLAKALLSMGVFIAVASGNDGENADTLSPGSEPSLCTVGAMNSSNQMADFSNYGSVVDILAPGVDILSASSLNTTAVVGHPPRESTVETVRAYA